MKPKFLFINTRQAQCSIYKSGIQVYNALHPSPYWDMDYVEINELDPVALSQGRMVQSGQALDAYDVYIFNYHDITMRTVEKIDSRWFDKLPGIKLSIILEMEPNNPLSRLFSDDFNGYLVLDPTMQYKDPRFIAFPRPIKSIKHEYMPAVRPVIGSFGLPTQDKYFDRIIDAVNIEFNSALVRLNIPKASYADPDDRIFNEISRLCKSKAKTGVEVEITRHFFTDADLIRWCSQNTINVFLYDRNMPGLSAVTDQAIASGRPLAVSNNVTFRHIHKYLEPYPNLSLQEAIENSDMAVQQMQQDWSPEACQQKLRDVLFKE